MTDIPAEVNACNLCDSVHYLQWVDCKLLEFGMFPVGVAVGILGLLIAWLWPEICNKIGKKRHA